MPADTLSILAALFLVVGELSASVGHAGASGYLAVMALVGGVEAAVMRPTALSINVLVATIAFTQFARAGHFRWGLFWPFAAASIPAAYQGGLVQLLVEGSQHVLNGRFSGDVYGDAARFFTRSCSTEAEHIDFHRGSIWFSRWGLGQERAWAFEVRHSRSTHPRLAWRL